MIVRKLSSARSTSIRVLIDDDTAFRQVMMSELSRLGYEVDAVDTGEEAIRRAVATEPQVVVPKRLPEPSGDQTGCRKVSVLEVPVEGVEHTLAPAAIAVRSQLEDRAAACSIRLTPPTDPVRRLAPI